MKRRIIKLIYGMIVYSVVMPPATMGKERIPPTEQRTEAMGYFISAKRFEMKGDYRGAIVELLEAAARDPQSPMIPYAIARNYLYIGNQERAVEYARKVIALDPAFAEGRRFFLTVLRHSRDSTGVIADIERLVKEYPDDWETFSVLLTMYLDRGEQEKAAKLLKRLRRREDLPPSVAVGAASFLVSMKRYKEAEQFYRTAIIADSTAEEAWLGLGMILETLGDKQQAIGLYREALKRSPKSDDLYGRLASLYASEGLLDEVLKDGTEHPDFYYALGVALIRSERYDDAAKVMGYVVSQSTTVDPEWWNNAAYVYIKVERYDDALDLLIRHAKTLQGDETTLSMVKFGVSHIQDRERITGLLAEALSHDPENDLLLSAHGTLLADEERWTEAIPSFEKATVLRPNNTDHLFDLGNALERSGRFDEAVTIFERLLKVDPEHSYALNYLGYMFAEKGIRLEESVEMLKKAIADRPDNGAFLDSLGWAYYRLGIFDKAEEYIDQAVQRIDMNDKENAVIFEHLGDVAKALGKVEKARTQWIKSLEIDPENITVRTKLESLTTK
ncbi:MAG: tetratricopeptide repeat protein [Candidatus Latescibacteria bacterium]|nr:tetratricopeptide repeat protein [Candidatus Latescibacterota bacterium]